MRNLLLLFAFAGLLLLPLQLQAADDGVPRFDIASYSVEGNTLLPSELISSIMNGYVGKDKDFGDVQEALEALESAYRKKGYNAVAVILPEQELDKGLVKLRVIEAKIRSFLVEDNKYHSNENILNAFPSLKIGITPKVTNVSKDLFISNENPSKKVSLQMLSGDNEDEIIGSLKVTDQRTWNLGVMGDNTGSGQTGDYRVSLLFQHHNVFNRDHSLTLVYNTSPEKLKEVKVYSLSYRIPVYTLGDSIEISAGYSDVDSGSIAYGDYKLLISGKGITSGIKYNLNLGRIGEYVHKMTLGFDFKDFDNRTNIEGTDSNLTPGVVVHPLSVNYTGTLGMEGVGDLGFNLSVIHNEPWGGKGQQSDFNLSSPGSRANYTLFRFGGNLGLSLPLDMQTKLTLTGQYSSDELVSGEQFHVGGSTSVRGYSESAVAGDGGVGGNIEIYSPNIATWLSIPDTQIRLLGFFDAGYAFSNKAATADTKIAGTGAGIRLSWAANFSFSFDWGYALKEGGGAKEGDTAIHFKTMFMY